MTSSLALKGSQVNKHANMVNAFSRLFLVENSSTFESILRRTSKQFRCFDRLFFFSLSFRLKTIRKEAYGKLNCVLDRTGER